MFTSSIWSIFFECFALGGIAFTLPCIFPLAPLTISFFAKKNERGEPVLLSALVYSASIILIYVGLGLLITLIYGAGALNELASDGYFNLFVFVVLMGFGISLLGFFEIVLPNRWLNHLADKSRAESVSGLFFLAATLATVSFSCTGPLIGTILVTVGQTSSYFAPAVGMLGFSSALALIFLLFALFPQALKFLPKSGAWLNTIKVGLGLLEIALALKFLSNADLAYHWNLLNRELFLGIWILLTLVFALNLLGIIQFPHDSRLTRISPIRAGMSVISFTLVGFMSPGLFGAPLPALSGFLPPASALPLLIDKRPSEASPSKKRYQDLFHMPHGIDGFFDFQEALTYARKVNKPMLLDFTGHGCVNCRKMEAEVWSDAKVLALLKQKYIVVSLYTDDKTALPTSEQFDSALLKTRINTIGKLFKELQARRFATISQPYYVLMGTDEQLLVKPPIGVELDVDRYLAYLESGLAQFAAQTR